jgi:hypothetical protein
LLHAYPFIIRRLEIAKEMKVRKAPEKKRKSSKQLSQVENSNQCDHYSWPAGIRSDVQLLQNT